MAKTLREAIEKNRVAAEELDKALRECLSVIRDKPESVVEGRFQVFLGGRTAQR